MRPSELLKVRDDSLSSRGVTFLDRKTGDNLTVPMTTRANEAIQRLLKSSYWRKRVRGARDDPKRAASAQHWVTHRFSEIRDRAGLKDVTERYAHLAPTSLGGAIGVLENRANRTDNVVPIKRGDDP